MTRAVCLTFMLLILLLGTPAFALEGGYYNTGYDYLPVQDDAELGEILLFDIIAQGFGLPLIDVISIHDEYDLYPEEIATLLHLAKLSDRDIDYIADKRADDRYSWKGLGEKLHIAPEDLGQSSRWYRQGQPDDWWQEDVEVEREVVTDMLAGAYGVDRRVVWDWAADGLGYGDAAVALELERRSGQPAEEILYQKMNGQARWDEVADDLGVHVDDLYAKRSMHYHDREFRSYIDTDRVYHVNRTNREHRSRREYHYYDVWVEPDHDYFRFDYGHDYDHYFPYGRVSYAYWCPPSWDYGRIYPTCHWTTSVFHPIPWPAPMYVMPARPLRPPTSPTMPVQRDTRRYALQLGDTGSRSVAMPGGSGSRTVRSAPRDSTGGPGVTREVSGADQARQDSRDRQRAAEAAERSSSRKSSSPAPRTSSSPAPRSSAPPASRSGSTSSRDSRSSSPPSPPRSSGSSRGSESPSAPSAASPSKPSAPPSSPPAAPSGRSGSRKGGGR